jgi:hypothetical protein
VLYLPAPGEYADGSFTLPWNDADARGSIVGSFARERGATVPDRVVSSAKSWLCNPDVDRRASILPWKSDLGDAKVSPFEATRRYLAHLRHAAESHLAQRDDGATLADCQIVLTVPASFDEVARTLTHEAALAVGLSDVTLLEEPQAAFYAWINQSAHAPGATPWTDEVAPGDLVLVCDIGGGTADFSLIAVAAAPAGLSKNLELHRVAVGEHILLGGDNMDLALAYHLRGKLEEGGHELDAWQFQALVHATREAKEKLLGNDALAEAQVAVPSRGASLFAKTVATTLARDAVVAILTEGYFPITAAGDLPAPRKSVGLQEYGLDYATEPAVSRHLARFLRRALENVRSDPELATRVGAAEAAAPVDLLRPTAVLFNGGVFEAASFRARVVELLRAWFGADHALKELQSAGLNIAVSRGAAITARCAPRARASRSRPARRGRTSWAREPGAGGPGLRAAGQGRLCRTAGHEGRHRARAARPRIRPRHRRGGAVPLLRFRSSCRRSRRHRRRQCAEDARRAARSLGHAAGARGRERTGRAGHAASARHRGRHAGAVAAPQAVREAMEARLQSPRRRVTRWPGAA